MFMSVEQKYLVHDGYLMSQTLQELNLVEENQNYCR